MAALSAPEKNHAQLTVFYLPVTSRPALYGKNGRTLLALNFAFLASYEK
jgi:hypothetical protein